MNKCRTINRTLALSIALFLISCGPTEGSTKFAIPGPDVLPLTSSDGAEEGLRGCLNRALYFNGPNYVTTSEIKSITTRDGTFDETYSTDSKYTVVEVTADGTSHVDHTLEASSSGSASVVPLTLAGYTLFAVGASRAEPDPMPFLMKYDLKPGETVSSVIPGAGLETIREYFYDGREEIMVQGRQVKACRVDTIVTTPSEAPQFVITSRISTWYGVGTGLKLRLEGVGYPDSEPDRSTSLHSLQSATINSTKIF